jgi:flagellar basal-body rod protein FlgC
MKIDRVFSGLNISSQGLSAQRRRLNAIASNLANAETTKTEAGGPYRRKIVELKSLGRQVFSSLVHQAGIKLATTNGTHLSGGGIESSGPAGSVEDIQTREVEDPAPSRQVYDPGNPDADANGYVAMPNVNVVTEMVGMISATRSFEANVVAVNAAKNMAKDALEI